MRPHMERENLAAFERVTAKSRVYLEYGSGGSTVHVASKTKADTLISIESDPAWVEKVRQALADSGAPNIASRVHLDYCDIGQVGSWGSPLDISGHARYHNYITRPWRRAAALNVSPDLVLIDGRFRVACFLYSLLCAKAGTTMLFDDYVERPEYFIVEDFCVRRATHGSLAIFEVGKSYDVPRLVALLLAYSQAAADKLPWPDDVGDLDNR